MALAALPAAAPARVLEGRDAALQRVFGAAARFAPRTVYPTADQIESVRALARARVPTAPFTYWEATRGDTTLGRAYLDTHPVRTMPATVLVAVSPGGEVMAVEILAFHEPEDYLPPRRWLERLRGRRLSPRLRPGDEVDGISGATLSARAVTEATRRALAFDRILHGAPSP